MVVVELWVALYIFLMLFSSYVWLASIFSHYGDCLLTFIVSFAHMLSVLIKSNLIFLFYIQKIIIKTSVEWLTALFSPGSFMIPWFTFKSLNIWVNFCEWYKILSSFFLWQIAVWFSQHYLLRRLSSLGDHYLQAFYTVAFIYVSVSVPVLYCLNYYNFVV